MKTSSSLVLAFFVSMAAVGAESADAIRACAKKGNGQLRVLASTEQCLPSEELVVLSAGGPATAAPGVLRAIDAVGRELGPFTPAGVVAGMVVMEVPTQRWVTVFLNTDFVQGVMSLNFIQPDCQGPAYMFSDPRTLSPLGLFMLRADGSRTLFYPSLEVATTRMESEWRWDGTSWSCNNWTISAPFAKAETMDVSFFVPPFRLTR